MGVVGGGGGVCPSCGIFCCSSSSSSATRLSNVHAPNFPSWNERRKNRCAASRSSSPPVRTAPIRVASASSSSCRSFVGDVKSGGSGSAER